MSQMCSNWQTTWQNITDMPTSLTSYTDVTPPAEGLTYYIETFHPAGIYNFPPTTETKYFTGY